MTRILPFGIFFDLEQVLPKGHKLFFSVHMFPTLGQNGPAIRSL